MRAAVLMTLALATIGAGPASAHHAPAADAPEIDAAGLAAGRELAEREWGQSAVCGGTPVIARLRTLPDTYLATYSVGHEYETQDPAKYRDCTFDMNDAHPEWYRDPYTVCRAVVHESGHLTAHEHADDDTQPMGHGEYVPCRERFPLPATATTAEPSHPAAATPRAVPPEPAPYVSPTAKRERLYGKRRCSRAHHRRLHRHHVAHKHERRTRCYRAAL